MRIFIKDALFFAVLHWLLLRHLHYPGGTALAYSFLDLALDVLKQAQQPMTYQELWQTGIDLGLVSKIKTAGKTPWHSLGAQLYVDVRDNESSRFTKVGKRPARFFLKEREAEVTNALVAKIDQPKSTGATAKGETKFKERDLHPILTYFAYANPAFNRGREIITKTIFHEKSKKSGYSDWTHPDMVGFSIPLQDWQPDVIAFNDLTDRNSLVLFSFEIKRHISKSTYRESFFQAVSNSSWAHQGYLVTAGIDEDDDLLAELERLASSFGIGIIQIDLADMSESRVVYPARVRSSLDWETINKLCEQNEDFQKFLQSVKIDVTSRKIHRAEYDSVLQDIDQYISNLGKKTGT